MALLSQSSNLKEKKQLCGWIDKSAYFPFNQVFFIEPKWNKRELEYLDGTNVVIKDSEGNNIINFSYTKDIKRLAGEIFRVPVHEIDTINNTYKVTLFLSEDCVIDSSNNQYYNYLAEKFGKEFADRRSNSSQLIAVTGYIPIKNKDGRDLWEPVICISNTELVNLMKRLKAVYRQAREGGNNRLEFVKALKNIVIDMVGSDALAAYTGFNNITHMLVGLNSATKSSVTDSYKIKDLLDPNVVDNSKYRKLLYDFKTKYERLEAIQRNYYYKKRDVVDDNVTYYYYWIPIADLP